MLVQASGKISVLAPLPGLHLITNDVVGWLTDHGVDSGVLTLFCRHTSASLLIQENAAPAARRDLEAYFARIAPESNGYEHDDEGPDDMPAHVRTALTTVNLSLPVSGGRVCLGTWQGIYVWEHRRVPHTRSVVVHVIGDEE
jgi:secondary thiamine-phosphate synthase enzyme